MKQEAFCRELSRLTGDVPEQFHQRVEAVLSEAVRQEANEALQEENAWRRAAARWRLGRRAAVLTLLALLLLGTAAFAARKWGVFDALSAILGHQPPTADSVLQSDLYQTVVNGVTITVTEAGYDGKTLFVQYSYRLPGVTEPLGRNLKHGSQRYITPSELELLNRYHVGWWVDALWINGQSITMPGDSGGTWRGSEVPGELVRTEYWRLDKENIFLTGDVTITLPVGEKQPPEYRSTIFSKEAQQYTLPDRGVISFTLDTAKTLSRVITLRSGLQTVTPDVTARVAELTFTPLLTYITLDLTANPASVAAYREAYGEGVFGSDGSLMHAWDGADVFGGWMASLALVDGDGRLLFPGHSGILSCSSERAEYSFPYVQPVPEELWLAPVEGDVANLSEAIRVK